MNNLIKYDKIITIFIILFIISFVECVLFSDNCNFNGITFNNYYSGFSSVGDGETSIFINSIIPPQDDSVIMIIQIQGGTIDTSNSEFYGSGTSPEGYGYETVSSGNYEFNVVISSFIGTTTSEISLLYPLEGTYSNNENNRFQILSVPYCGNAIITSTADIPWKAWDGNKGGVIALLAHNIHISGTIDLSGIGFRGAPEINIGGGNGNSIKENYVDDTCDGSGVANGYKGEGFIGYPSGLIENIDSSYPNNGCCAKGAPGNAGGGGNYRDGGGGGGGNGGRGGRGRAINSPNFHNAGIGGDASPFDFDKIFLGGGGGSGHRNNEGSPNITVGRSGAGILYFHCNNSVTIDNAEILANGESPINSSENNGGGGGGAGGTLVIISDSDPGNDWSDIFIDIQGGSGSSVSSNTGGGGGGGGGILISSSFSFSVSPILNGGSQGFGGSFDGEDGVDGQTLLDRDATIFSSEKIFNIPIIPSITLSSTPTITPTFQISISPTLSLESPQISISNDITNTFSQSITPATSSISITQSTQTISIPVSQSEEITHSISQTISGIIPSQSVTMSIISNTPSVSQTQSIGSTPSISISPTPSQSATMSIISNTPSISQTQSIGSTPSISISPTPSQSKSNTISIISNTPSVSQTQSIGSTPSISKSVTSSISFSQSFGISESIITSQSISIVGSPIISNIISISQDNSNSINIENSLLNTPSQSLSNRIFLTIEGPSNIISPSKTKSHIPKTIISFPTHSPNNILNIYYTNIDDTNIIEEELISTNGIILGSVVIESNINEYNIILEEVIDYIESNTLPIVSSVVNIISIDEFGNEIPFSDTAEICLQRNNNINTEESCLGYFNEKKQEWICEDSCIEEKENGLLCGTTSHFTNFAILFEGINHNCNSDDNGYIFDELWKDIVLIASCCLFACIISLIFIILVLKVDIFNLLVFGNEGNRVTKIRIAKINYMTNGKIPTI